MSAIIFGNQADLQGIDTSTTHVEGENPTSDVLDQSSCWSKVKSCWNNTCVQIIICMLFFLVVYLYLYMGGI